MKRLITALSMSALILLVAIAFTSCSTGGLDTPTGLDVNGDNDLSWSAVLLARSYVIEITHPNGEKTEETTRKTSISLSGYDEGDYEFRVRARGGKENDTWSEWSDTLSYYKTYETGCVYELSATGTEYTIKRGGNAKNVVIIEDVYRGKPVTAIADNAFKGNKDIVEVVIGANVKTIGASAFYNCGSLTKVTIPDGVTLIGEEAFHGCRALESVNIPAGIDTIPASCFINCKSLSSITLGDNITSIGESAFESTAIESLVIPNSVTEIGTEICSRSLALTEITIGTGLTSIPESAFYNISTLKTVKFAEGSQITSIGNYAFAESSALETIHLPESVTVIGNGAFRGCSSLSDITITDNITRIGLAAFTDTKLYDDTTGNFVYVGKWLVAVKDRTSLVEVAAADIKNDTLGIADGCFRESTELVKIILPDSVKYLGTQAFYLCTKLQSFTSGKDLEEIGSYGFGGCTALFQLNLKNSLKTIGSYAFIACIGVNNNKLNSIIPESVTRIGTYAFYSSGLWNSPDEKTHVIYAGDWVVGYDSENAPAGIISLEDTVIGISDYAFINCEKVTGISNLSKCKNVGVGAFYGCLALEAVTFHQDIKEIKSYTFFNCPSLLVVYFPLRLESVGSSAFRGCSSLTSLDFSETFSFKSIGSLAFYGCKNIKTVTFGDEITEIGYGAFRQCHSITSITIPDTVANISTYAFSFCIALENVTIESGVETIGNKAFYGCQALTELTLPDSVTSIGQSAFYNCTALTKLDLGNSITSIGNFAFYNVSNLTELVIPKSLESVGKYAFKGMTGLHAVIIPANVKTIGASAFYGCSGATFFVEDGADTEGWDTRWNSSNRPVVRGVKLSWDGSYVESLTVREDTVTNGKYISTSITPICNPSKEGFVFNGWKNADGMIIGTALIENEAIGSELTAVWTSTSAIPVVPDKDAETDDVSPIE